MQLNNPLGDCEPETGSAFGLGVGVVDLVELLKDALQLILRYPRTRVSHGNNEVAVHDRRADAYLTSVGELDRVADEVEEHLGESLFVAKADGQMFGNSCLERELFRFCQ